MSAPLDGEFASLHSSPPTSGMARRRWRRGALLERESASLHLSPPIFMSSFAPSGGVRRAGAGRLLRLAYWTRCTPSFAPPGGVRGAGAGAAAATTQQDEVYAFLGTARRSARRLERPLLDQVYGFLRRKVACAELELDGCCWYPTGRDVRLPSRHQVACAEQEQDGTERSGPTRTAFRRKAGRAGAAQEEQLLLLRNTAAAGLDSCWIYVCVCMCLCSCGL